ncbi:MAG: 16S rRNA (uracil(1498)-N(3))-methyltransferase [Thermodesulfobacteriota bacterium]
MRRFFLPREAFSEETAIIAGSDAHHIRNVLRLRRGDRIRVFDGSGLEYIAAISSMTDTGVELRLGEKISSVKEGPFRLSIGQALLKARKMDFIVQKMTELGVFALYPFICERTIPTADMEKMPHKKERWEKIAVEAAKQCNRHILPVIHDVQDMTSTLADCQKNDLKIMLWEKVSDNNLKRVLTQAQATERVCALIGPEGGFSAREAEEAVRAGFIPVGLGRRVLRAETATLAVISIIQYELGYI